MANQKAVHYCWVAACRLGALQRRLAPSKWPYAGDTEPRLTESQRQIPEWPAQAAAACHARTWQTGAPEAGIGNAEPGKVGGWLDRDNGQLSGRGKRSQEGAGPGRSKPCTRASMKSDAWPLRPRRKPKATAVSLTDSSAVADNLHDLWLMVDPGAHESQVLSLRSPLGLVAMPCSQSELGLDTGHGVLYCKPFALASTGESYMSRDVHALLDQAAPIGAVSGQRLSQVRAMDVVVRAWPVRVQQPLAHGSCRAVSAPVTRAIALRWIPPSCGYDGRGRRSVGPLRRKSW